MRKQIALLTVALGMWLIAVPLTFQLPSCALTLSDFVSGLLFIFLALLTLNPKRAFSGWLIGMVGVWLQFAPLAFWAPSPALYLNDTLCGILAIVFAFLIANGKEVATPNIAPTGWSFNPSTWKHRLPTVGLAMLCWFFARYMAAYQLGYLPQVWDPFFQDGTLKVITSNVSHAFPVSDAGLGALCYTIEFLLGWQGGTQRYSSTPWLVFSFAFLVIPVGVVSTTLIILQPVIVGAWCSWCLGTAAMMLLMIIFTAAEFAAVLQFLAERKAQGESLWKVFWKGSSAKNTQKSAPVKSQSSGMPGITLPWNLCLSILIGIALMSTPSFLGLSGALATSDYIQGPIIVAISVISMAEVFRTLRYVNILLALWLVFAPWFLAPISHVTAVHLMLGALLFALAWRKGEIRQSYGAWERFII